MNANLSAAKNAHSDRGESQGSCDAVIEDKFQPSGSEEVESVLPLTGQQRESRISGQLLGGPQNKEVQCWKAAQRSACTVPFKTNM